jgi:hypothetical protein
MDSQIKKISIFLKLSLTVLIKLQELEMIALDKAA